MAILELLFCPTGSVGPQRWKGQRGARSLPVLVGKGGCFPTLGCLLLRQFLLCESVCDCQGGKLLACACRGNLQVLASLREEPLVKPSPASCPAVLRIGVANHLSVCSALFPVIRAHSHPTRQACTRIGSCERVPARQD